MTAAASSGAIKPALKKVMGADMGRSVRRGDASVTADRGRNVRPPPGDCRRMNAKRTSLIALLAAVPALAFAASAPAQAPVEWSYQGATGPAHWADLSPAFRTCGEGVRQSPI